MECQILSHDPVFQEAARIAGFAEAAVVETETGKVVVVRHRRSRAGWAPFEHLEPGECTLSGFYGRAFWERADVHALFSRKQEINESSLLRAERDISGDFARDMHRFVVRRPDGKNDVAEALAAIQRGQSPRVVRQGWR